MFTWDDTRLESEAIANIFNKFDLKTTFFLNTQALCSKKFILKHPFARSMYRNFVKAGHEIGSHTHKHVNLVEVTLEDAENEIKTSSDAIRDIFGYKPSTMSHPTSHYNWQIDSLTVLYYLDSRYSMAKDQESTIWYMQVRTAYNFDTYKKDLDAFV